MGSRRGKKKICIYILLRQLGDKNYLIKQITNMISRTTTKKIII